MPNRILLIFITLLLGIGSASAQKYPERSLVRKGNRDFAKERYDRSIERYTQALEAAPENFEAAYNLGGALYRTEKYEEAAKMLERIAADSTRTDQERAEAFYNLGNAQFKQEKYPEALESYKNSLRMNPADQEAKYNYAYTKRLLDENKDGGGGGGDQNKDQNQDQNKDQNQNDQSQQNPDQKGDQKDQKGDPKDQQGDQKQNPQEGKGDKEDQGDQQGQPTPSGISPQEQQQMLDAIQAQEDKTQEKLKEKQGVVVRGKKNW